VGTSNAQKLRMSGKQIRLYVQPKLFGVEERRISNLGKKLCALPRCDISDKRYVLSFRTQSAL